MADEQFPAAVTALEEYHNIEQQMAEPEVASNPDKMRKLGRRHAELGAIVSAYTAYKQVKDDLEAAREMASEDPDFAEEAKRLEGELPAAEEKLRTALIPRDPDDARDTIMEIKAGTGGEEAALFAGDLLRMYMRYAEKRGWSVTVQSENTTELGGVLALHGDRPAALFRVSHVHTQQVAGEQRRFLATGAGLDLHDRVTRVIGVTRNQRGAQLLFGCGQLAFQPLGLFGEIGIFGRHLAGRLQIVLHLLVCGVGGDDGTQFGVAPTQLAHLVGIGCDLRLGHLLFDIVVFLKRGDGRGELFVCQCTPFLRICASAESLVAEPYSTCPSYKVARKCGRRR